MSLQSLCLFSHNTYLHFADKDLTGMILLLLLAFTEPWNDAVFSKVFSNSSFDEAEANATIIFCLLDKNNDSLLRDDDTSGFFSEWYFNQSWTLVILTTSLLNFFHHFILNLLDNNFMSTSLDYKTKHPSLTPNYYI